jgi:hypothetical protein
MFCPPSKESKLVCSEEAYHINAGCLGCFELSQNCSSARNALGENSVERHMLPESTGLCKKLVEGAGFCWFFVGFF